MLEAARQAFLLHKHAPKLKHLYVSEEYIHNFSQRLITEYKHLHFHSSSKDKWLCNSKAISSLLQCGFFVL